MLNEAVLCGDESRICSLRNGRISAVLGIGFLPFAESRA